MSTRIGFIRSGRGSGGRPTGPQLKACAFPGTPGPQFHDSIKVAIGANKFAIVPCCTPARPKLWYMIKTNDWWYQKGNVNSTTGGAVTGGALGARRRRC